MSMRRLKKASIKTRACTDQKKTSIKTLIMSNLFTKIGKKIKIIGKEINITSKLKILILKPKKNLLSVFFYNKRIKKIIIIKL